MRRHLVLVLALVVACGCQKKASLDEPVGPVTVSISQPIQRDVTTFKEFIGRTQAVDEVLVKARVTGYLLSDHFRDGSEVKQGDLLFQIDPRTYQAKVDAARGEVQVAETKLKLAQTENERAKALYQENPRAISLKQLDQHQAEEDAAAAQVVAAKANLEVYQLELAFTKITSPIDGRVGRDVIGVGNLVTENLTTLTTVVSQTPMLVYFNIDEQSMLTALRKLYAGKLPPVASRKISVGMGLQDESGFPHTGVVDFASNTVDASTGTLTLRAEFENPPNENGLRLLMPGMFVRVRLPMGRPALAILVSEAAIGTDQGQKFVYVVDSSHQVEERSISVGAQQDDGLRVVTSGLKGDEWVVVSGIQLVRSGAKVKPAKVSMPVLPNGSSTSGVHSADAESGETKP